MCKETFLRLPQEKRTRFLDAAWEEFTRVSFADVSINQIVRRAGVPRGSFYQYFEDKEDLFSYLLTEVRERFAETYRQVVEDAGGDIFQAQLDCYEQFQRRDAAVPQLERCIQILRSNPGMDMQKMVPPKPAMELLEQVREKVDLTGFRRRDPEFVWLVFSLALMALGCAVMDSLTRPEGAEEYRRRLRDQLEIIKYGAFSMTYRPETA